MDRLEKYRQILKQVLAEHAEYTPSYGQIDTVPVVDQELDHFLLLDFGWDRNGRVFSIPFHAHIQNNKVWIEWDGTEPSITEELVERGIPKEDIVLAFYRPERRKLTDFAVT